MDQEPKVEPEVEPKVEPEVESEVEPVEALNDNDRVAMMLLVGSFLLFVSAMASIIAAPVPVFDCNGGVDFAVLLGVIRWFQLMFIFPVMWWFKVGAVSAWFALFVSSSIFMWHGLVADCNPKPTIVLMEKRPWDFVMVLLFSAGSLSAVVLHSLYQLGSAAYVMGWFYWQQVSGNPII